MASSNAAADGERRADRAQVGPRARAAAQGRIGSARQLLDVTLAGIVDQVEGDVDARHSNALFHGVRAAVAVSVNGRAVDAAMADEPAAPPVKGAAAATGCACREERKRRLLKELRALDAEGGA